MPMKFAIWILLAPAIAHAAPIAGTYSSPLGDLIVAEKNGVVTGRVKDAKNACGFPKGTAVLDGSRLDDSITGNFKACKIGDGCAGPVDGAVMLLVTKNGAQLSGAVHFDRGSCKTPIVGDGVSFKKQAGGAAKPPPAVEAKTPRETKGTPRQKAEALAAEGKKLIESGAEGSVEEAREKFKEAVATDPEYVEGYIGIGVTFTIRQRFDEALEQFKKAIEVNPSYPDGYYNSACVYAIKNDPEQALRYLRISFLNGWAQVDTLAADPDLKNLEGNPEFEKLKKGVL
jgi:hypothetical protein